MLISIIGATIFVSGISFIGVLFIFKRRMKLTVIKSLISVAAGSMLTVSLLDLLPEALETDFFEPQTIFATTLGSILFFFLFERVLHWHHCRCEEDERENNNRLHLAYFNLIGDAFHNLIDGFLIASAFMLDFHTGLVVTLAVVLHEIPQEISDFGILLYSGLKRSYALMFNLLIGLTAVLGAILFYNFSRTVEALVPLAAAFAAGNFLYLATADIIPELHHEKKSSRVIVHSLWLLAGVLIIVVAGIVLPHV